MPSLVDYKAIIIGSIILAAFNFLVTQSLSDDVAKLHVYFFRSVFFLYVSLCASVGYYKFCFIIQVYGSPNTFRTNFLYDIHSLISARSNAVLTNNQPFKNHILERQYFITYSSLIFNLHTYCL